ncbi:Serine phosphatase RsbU, regulator of sigma subunit [Streptomyces sp. OV198]|jgi:PAS domain-containing protein|uniref:SpoIIE family protein phosphatase n=1 Tax=Streptomyces sp. OV198 TaxID=1882787 RepID=UPI000BDA3472|nr:SpoIIE family protein phosphatase [Streptomyces sp. OV198]SOF02178.1 Serine phosphatase RsbU, regulator of sigma subunit [Streptomyces sp. OV198]
MVEQQREPTEQRPPSEPAVRPARHGEAGAAGLAATVDRLSAELRALREDSEARALVELAQGVLVERLHCAPAEAARQLQRLASDARISLPELAADIVNQAASDTIAHAAAEASAVQPAPGTGRTAEGAAEPQDEGASLRLRTAEAAAILAGDDIQALARALLDRALRPLGATAAAVWSAAPDGSLTLAGEAGFGPAEAARWRYVPPGLGTPAQQAIAEDRTLWITESGDALPPTIGGSGGTRAVVPVQGGGQRVGVLEVHWPGPHPALALQRQLDALAQLCALSLSDHDVESGSPPGGAAAWLVGLLDGVLESAALLRPLRDRDGRITDFVIEHTNERFTDPAGRPRGSLTGLPLLEAYPLFAAEGGLFERIKQVYSTGAPYHSQSTVLRFPGSPAPPAVIAAMGLARFGDVVLLSWRIPEGDAQLADLLKHAQRVSQIGAFEENLITGEITWTEQLSALYGLPPGAAPVPLHQLSGHAHPDDTGAVERFLRSVLHQREESAMTFRLRRADGVVRHLRVVAEPLCDASGLLVAVRGAYQDISSHHWTEVALAATRDRLAGAEQQAAERHRLARQLQRAIMPPTAHPVYKAGLRVAVRYRPAEEDQRVGGDWYDAVVLPDGPVLLAVGDIAGHGIDAATSMVVLRNALRGLAITGAGPGRLLSWLNSVACCLTEQVTATVVCGLFDPTARTLRWANAGHVPPVLVCREKAEALTPPDGVLLGAVDDASYEEARHELRPQDILLMYTDGLIERRDSSMEQALGQFLAAASRPVDDLDDYLDHLLSCDIADTDDDTCLIAVQPT